MNGIFSWMQWMTVQMPLTMSDEEMRNCCVRTLSAAAATNSGGVMMPPTCEARGK